MLRPGMLISDRYEIIDKVGSGGMADVYKAKCQRLNRFVAIKILKPEYSSDKNFVTKFRGEAQSAAGLSHPNIVNVYDVGDDQGLHYIVMELVEGITLKRFIERKGKLEVKEAVGIAIQIAQGLEAAHDNRIIHRDIKPQNIIISKDGKVKVTDFGIAKATNSNTITSNAMGSVHYLSPEQARGGYSDEKSDIYSLGVTLYEMLSGKVPFAGENTVSVALSHIQAEAISLRELDPAIPFSLDQIVQKCMQKKAERRYHSASELMIDLKKSIANPNGDFVKIPAFMASDSPTINIGDELGRIKNGISGSDTMQNKMMENESYIEEDDEEDLDTVDTKVEKVFVIGSIVAAVALGIIIIAIVITIFFRGRDKENEFDPGNTNEQNEDLITPTPDITEAPTPTEPPEEVTFRVPSVIGLTEQDARDSIEARSPSATVVVDVAYSDDVEEGLIIGQYPQADSEVELSAIVSLTMSAGSEPFEIPNVYNLREDQVDKKLEELGLVVIHEYPYSDTVEEGRVIRTSPERNTMVVKGDQVIVYVSSGPENSQVVIPNLIGKSMEEANQQLLNLGLVLGEVSAEASQTYEAGLVTFQSESAGQKVDQGTVIDLIVSSGYEVVEPDLPVGTPTTYRYIGQVIIDANPFEFLGYEEAEIILEMEQDGWVTIIKEDVLNRDSFPLTITNIEGESENAGVVKMYVDDVLYRVNGVEKTWNVEFEAVEE